MFENVRCALDFYYRCLSPFWKTSSMTEVLRYRRLPVDIIRHIICHARTVCNYFSRSFCGRMNASAISAPPNTSATTMPGTESKMAGITWP